VSELRCEGCGGPIVLRGGTDDQVILPTVRVTMGPDDPPGSLGRVSSVEGGPWCADCVRGWNERMGVDGGPVQR
jgi:hypothetical protein